jgi:hypothetical protein
VQRRVHVLAWDIQRLKRLAEGLVSSLHALDEPFFGVAEPLLKRSRSRWAVDRREWMLDVL